MKAENKHVKGLRSKKFSSTEDALSFLKETVSKEKDLMLDKGCALAYICEQSPEQYDHAVYKIAGIPRTEADRLKALYLRVVEVNLDWDKLRYLRKTFLMQYGPRVKPNMVDKLYDMWLNGATTKDLGVYVDTGVDMTGQTTTTTFDMLMGEKKLLDEALTLGGATLDKGVQKGRTGALMKIVQEYIDNHGVKDAA